MVDVGRSERRSPILGIRTLPFWIPSGSMGFSEILVRVVLRRNQPEIWRGHREDVGRMETDRRRVFIGNHCRDFGGLASGIHPGWKTETHYHLSRGQTPDGEGESDIDAADLREAYLGGDWLYYCRNTPIWAERIAKYGGICREDAKTVAFKSDDDLEAFYEAWGFEPDEQSREMHLKHGVIIV